MLNLLLVYIFLYKREKADRKFEKGNITYLNIKVAKGWQQSITSVDHLYVRQFYNTSKSNSRKKNISF